MSFIELNDNIIPKSEKWLDLTRDTELQVIYRYGTYLQTNVKTLS